MQMQILCRSCCDWVFDYRKLSIEDQVNCGSNRLLPELQVHWKMVGKVPMRVNQMLSDPNVAYSMSTETDQGCGHRRSVCHTRPETENEYNFPTGCIVARDDADTESNGSLIRHSLAFPLSDLSSFQIIHSLFEPYNALYVLRLFVKGAFLKLTAQTSSEIPFSH